MKKMNRHTWTSEQNEILKGFAKQVWQTKKELLSEIVEKMPEVTATSALYHALKHEKIVFTVLNGQLHEDIRLDAAKKLMEDCWDANTVAQYIHRVHHVLKKPRFYNGLRFRLTRGEYVILKDQNGKFYLEHRAIAAQAVGAEKIINKIVAHPTTIKVDNNLLGNLLITEPHILYKIKMINFVGKALELSFGALQEYINENVLQTKTVDAILKDMFKASGLNISAKNLFPPKSNSTQPNVN